MQQRRELEERHLVHFGPCLDPSGLAALFADLTNTTQRVREEARLAARARLGFSALVVIQVDAMPEKGRAAWDRKTTRLEEDVCHTQLKAC